MYAKSGTMIVPLFLKNEVWVVKRIKNPQ